MPSSRRTLLTVVGLLRALRSALALRAPTRDDPRAGALLDQASAARAAGRDDEARALFEQALRLHPADARRLAVTHYELGRLEAERGRSAAAVAHFKSALRADRGFVPAAVELGDAQARAGDVREAMRTWERAAEVQPALPLLGRLERVHRDEG